MFGFLDFFGSGKAKTTECCSLYSRGHWVVMIRNTGNSNWNPVLDHSKLITDQNAFGEVVRTRPAVMTFETKTEADNWIKNSVPEAAKTMNQTAPARGSANFSSNEHSDLPDSLRTA